MIQNSDAKWTYQSAAIAAFVKTQRQERGNARAADEVNQVLLERAMEASVGMPVYSDDVRHHVYRRAHLP
jgi:hypothetical protein